HVPRLYTTVYGCKGLAPVTGAVKQGRIHNVSFGDEDVAVGIHHPLECFPALGYRGRSIEVFRPWARKLQYRCKCPPHTPRAVSHIVAHGTHPEVVGLAR